MKLLLDRRVIVVRAPPEAGKTTLLQLLGTEILKNHPNLEPVRISWTSRSDETMAKKPYKGLLDEKLDEFRQLNDQERVNGNPIQFYFHRFIRACSKVVTPLIGATDRIKRLSYNQTVFLIDEAQNTYREPQMWDELFKNPDQRRNPYFVLVCVYGSASGTVQWGSSPSEASEIESHRRIELHSNVPDGPRMLLSSQEIREMVRIWANEHEPPFQHQDDVIEFLEFETQGHAGMLGRLLKHLSRMAQDDHVLSLPSAAYRELTGLFSLIEIAETLYNGIAHRVVN